MKGEQRNPSGRPPGDRGPTMYAACSSESSPTLGAVKVIGISEETEVSSAHRVWLQSSSHPSTVPLSSRFALAPPSGPGRPAPAEPPQPSSTSPQGTQVWAGVGGEAGVSGVLAFLLHLLRDSVNRTQVKQLSLQA